MAAPVSAQPAAIIPDLVITRDLRAPRALVWQAWTDPAHIVKWWGPQRFTCPRADIDLRPGGAVHFDMQAPDGTIFPTTGTVDEVDAPTRLVVTTRLIREGTTLLEVRQTVTLEEMGDRTKLTLHAHVLVATDAAAGPLAGMREGWGQTLDKLTSYTTTRASERELVLTRRFRAPIETIWEAWTTPAHLETWWGPTGFTTTTARFDLTPGGQWVHTMHGPDGIDYPNVITFREVVPGRRLTYAQSGGRDGEPAIQFESTIVFERDGEDTRVTLRMQFASAEERQAVNDEYGAYEGGLQMLDRLANRLHVA